MRELMSAKDKTFPQHIAIIMDGNRRWARSRGLEIIRGHKKVAQEKIEELADKCIELKIPFLTLWAFSTQNWERSEGEVKLLLDLFREMLDKNIEELHQKGIRVETIGGLERFPIDIKEKIRHGVEKTKHNQRLTLTFALNYGGRDELARAVTKIPASDFAKLANLETKKVEAKITQSLDTTRAGLPAPDLIIRPGGEKRLSGFMLWQAEYSELYFSEVLMPDFGASELEKAIKAYQQRQRRFGR